MPRPVADSLLALVRQTPRGIWTVEARLLYDLQKACVDHEREMYTIDVVEWALSWGRRPMKRRLPAQRDVLMLKHLRSAARRLAAARIAEQRRRQLARLLRRRVARIEARLREQLRPRIVAALDDVGLLPQNLPERVARKKLVEELLDRIVDQGFLAIGDLRDAISRNNLKLPDLSGRVDFLRGDRLLRADRRMLRCRWTASIGGARSTYAGCSASARPDSARASADWLLALWWCRSAGPIVTLVGRERNLASCSKDIAAGSTMPDMGFHLTYPPPIRHCLLGLFLLCVVQFCAAFRRGDRRFFKRCSASISCRHRSSRFAGLSNRRGCGRSSAAAPFILLFRFLDQAGSFGPPSSGGSFSSTATTGKPPRERSRRSFWRSISC